MKTLIGIIFTCFVLLSTSVARADDWQLLPDGDVVDGDNPQLPFVYCDRWKVQDGVCTVLGVTDNQEWVSFKSPGDSHCETGYFGYINVMTSKGYLVAPPFTCGHPNMRMLLDHDAQGNWLYGIAEGNKLLGYAKLR